MLDSNVPNEHTNPGHLSAAELNVLWPVVLLTRIKIVIAVSGNMHKTRTEDFSLESWSVLEEERRHGKWVIGWRTPTTLVNGRLYVLPSFLAGILGQRFHWVMAIFWSRKVHFENPSNPSDNPFIHSSHRYSSNTVDQLSTTPRVHFHHHRPSTPSGSCGSGCHERDFDCVCAWVGVSKGTRINWANSGIKV